MTQNNLWMQVAKEIRDLGFDAPTLGEHHSSWLPKLLIVLDALKREREEGFTCPLEHLDKQDPVDPK